MTNGTDRFSSLETFPTSATLERSIDESVVRDNMAFTPRQLDAHGIEMDAVEESEERLNLRNIRQSTLELSPNRINRIPSPVNDEANFDRFINRGNVESGMLFVPCMFNLTVFLLPTQKTQTASHRKQAPREVHFQ